MARAKRKKKFTVQFALSIPGLFGIGIVCFCIFLWMFLLGIWAGQTILPTASLENVLSGKKFVSALMKGKETVEEEENTVVTIEEENKWQPEKEASLEWEAEPDLSGTSLFALQVSSFSDEKEATKKTLALRARGYDAYTLPPGHEEENFQVLVGRFDDLSAANSQASEFEKKEKTSVYITLIPHSRLNKIKR